MDPNADVVAESNVAVSRSSVGKGLPIPPEDKQAHR